MASYEYDDVFVTEPLEVVSCRMSPDWDRITWSVTCGWLFGNDHANPVSAPVPSFVTVAEVPLPPLPAPDGYVTEATSPCWYVGTATTLPSAVNCVTFESMS